MDRVRAWSIFLFVISTYAAQSKAATYRQVYQEFIDTGFFKQIHFYEMQNALNPYFCGNGGLTENELSVIRVCARNDHPIRSKIGVIILHGKDRGPEEELAHLHYFLLQKGFRVSAPDMPWSLTRDYIKKAGASVKETKLEIIKLQEQGARQIFIAGQSMGAGLASFMASKSRNFAGLIMISTGHAVDRIARRDTIRYSLKKAKSMIKDGYGGQPAAFVTNNQGKIATKIMKPRIFFSYYDPEGMFALPKNFRRIRRPLPILWVASQNDMVSIRTHHYAFKFAAEHPQSIYYLTPGNHVTSSIWSKSRISNWIDLVVSENNLNLN